MPDGFPISARCSSASITAALSNRIFHAFARRNSSATAAISSAATRSVSVSSEKQSHAIEQSPARARRQRLQLGDDADVVVHRAAVAADEPQLGRGAGGDAEAARVGAGIIDDDSRLRPEAVAHELEHLGAREAALADAHQAHERAADAMRDERRLLGERRSEAARRGEAIEQARVVRIDRARGDADRGGRDAGSEQLADFIADRFELGVFRFVFDDDRRERLSLHGRDELPR